MAVIESGGSDHNNKGYKSDFLSKAAGGDDDPSSTVVCPLPTFEPKDDDVDVVVLERDTLSLDPTSRKNIYRHYHNYTIVMNQKHRCALFVALNIDQSLLEKTDNETSWRIDDDLVGSENQLNDDYYKSNAWDKGHMAADASAGWGHSQEERTQATNDTYYYTNATLQHENFNRDEWKDVEFYIRSKKKTFGNKVNEISGTIFLPADNNNNPKIVVVKPEGRPEARVPDGFFKVISYLDATSSEQLRVECFVLYQDQETLEDRKGNNDIYKKYQVTLDHIEELTGLKFDPIYHQANKDALQHQQQQKDDEEETATATTSTSVKIAAAMVDPKGKDSGSEWISLVVSGQDDDPLGLLNGWKLQDQKGRSLVLNSDTPTTTTDGDDGKTTIVITEIKPIRLTNGGGSISLYNDQGKLSHQVKYTKDQVQDGVEVTF